MKIRFLTILLLCLPVILCAQNYEKEGDDLFAQAQYEKAAKKYSAAIELSGTSSSLQSKKEKCTKCASLLSRAKSAEASATDVDGYEKASKLYSDLFAVHALSTYKSKANALKQKANDVIEQQRAAEQAERERKAKLEAERKAKAEAERKATLEKERKAKEAEDERKIKELKEIEARLDAAIAKKAGLTQILEALEAPLGLQHIQWTDPKKEQKKELLKNSHLTSQNYTIMGLTSAPECYYVISNVLFDLNANKGKEIEVRYSMHAPTSIDAKLTAHEIFQELIKRGFNMSSFVNASRCIFSSSKSPCVFNNIMFTKMKVDYLGTNINISFTINRRYSAKRTSTQKKVK